MTIWTNITAVRCGRCIYNTLVHTPNVYKKCLKTKTNTISKPVVGIMSVRCLYGGYEFNLMACNNEYAFKIAKYVNKPAILFVLLRIKKINDEKYLLAALYTSM